jgi:hypothetical protein
VPETKLYYESLKEEVRQNAEPKDKGSTGQMLLRMEADTKRKFIEIRANFGVSASSITLCAIGRLLRRARADESFDYSLQRKDPLAGRVKVGPKFMAPVPPPLTEEELAAQDEALRELKVDFAKKKSRSTLRQATKIAELVDAGLSLTKIAKRLDTPLGMISMAHQLTKISPLLAQALSDGLICSARAVCDLSNAPESLQVELINEARNHPEGPMVISQKRVHEARKAQYSILDIQLPAVSPLQAMKLLAMLEQTTEGKTSGLPVLEPTNGPILEAKELVQRLQSALFAM